MATNVEKQAWTNLEARLHALAENFTRGKYGDADDFDEAVIIIDFEDAIGNYMADLACCDEGNEEDE